MTAITYDGATPTVGADADTWGAELNDGALAKIKVDLDMLNTAPTATILGRVTASTGEVERLTGAQAATVVGAMNGATQSVAGLKGSAPAPAAGDQNKVLGGDGTWRSGLGRAFGCIITTTNVNASQPTLTGSLNVASISTLSVSGGYASATLTFTNALPSSAFAVHVTAGIGFPDGGYLTKTTTTVVVGWSTGGGGGTEVSVSGFF